MHGLEIEWQDEIDFVYIDIDDPRAEELKRELGYRVQPHVFLLDGEGTVLQQWFGFVAAEELEAAFESATQ